MSSTTPSQSLHKRGNGLRERFIGIWGSLAAALTAEILAYLGLVMIPIWLFRDVIQGRSLWVGSFDRLNGFLSVHLQYLHSLKSESLAAWDPSLFLGVNIIGFAHTFPNPLTFLAALAPTEQAYWVAALISCGLLACSGLAAYQFVRDNTDTALPAFVGAVLYQLSASSVLRIAQNDMTFAVWIHLPIGMLFVRRLTMRRSPSLLIGLAGLLISLLTFTFLQEAAYAILLLGAFALYRAIVTRSVLPPVILGLALGIAVIGAYPRLNTVAQEFRQLNRLEPRPFTEVYEFQNVRPREIARWFEDGIFGRYPSEAAQLGNNINLHEGLLIHSSVFATLLVIASTIRYRGRWFGLVRTTRGDAPFHLLILLLGLVIVFRPVAQIAHWLAFGVDFTHSRAAVAALPGVSVLVGLALDERLRLFAVRRPLTMALTGGLAIAAAAMLLLVIGVNAESVSLARISTAEPASFIMQQNLELLTTGEPGTVLKSPPRLTATVEQITHVRLTWDDVLGETGYSIEMRDGNDPYREIARPNAQATSQVIENAAFGRRLTFRILACNDDGCAEPSAELAVPMPAESDFLPFDATRAPGEFAGRAFAAGQFELVWTDVIGEDSYRIELEQPDGTFKEIGRAAQSWTSYRIGDLGKQVSYTFRVRACLGEQCSPYAGPLTLTPPSQEALAADALPPATAPTNLEAVAVSGDTIKLAWAASDFADRYQVEMQGPGGELAVIGEAVSDPPRYTIGGVAENNGYRFFVRACNAHGCSERSNEVQVTPSGATARTLLEAPTDITVSVADGERRLSWPAAPAATGYAVERRDSPDQPFASITRVDSPTYAYRPASPQEAADLRIRACDASGCSFGSKATVFGRVTGRPAAPTGVKLMSTEAGVLQAAWEPVPGATSYILKVRTHLGDSPTRIEINAQSGESVDAPWPELNEETWADVQACVDSICSPPSAPADLAGEERWRLPEPPGQFTVRTEDTTSLGLSWQRVADATEYYLEIAAPGSMDYMPAGTIPGSATDYRLENLAPESVYLVRIRSCRDGRCSSHSQATAGVTHVLPSVDALDDADPHVTWLRSASLLKVEYAAGVSILLLGLAVLLRAWPAGTSTVALTLAALMVLDATGNADLQMNGRQTHNPPVPFADDDSYTAGPGDLQLPSAEDLDALHTRLSVADSRAVLICDGGRAPAICTQHVSRFWQLRLADGSSMGLPARIAVLPWSPENVSRRVVMFSSSERLPWGILGLLNVRQAIIVDVPFYLNRVRPDGRPGLDAEIVPNPMTVIPRQFFAENVESVPDAAAAARALFPDGRRDTTPDVEHRSVAEGLEADEHFGAGGQIEASYVGDTINLRLEPSDSRRFLVLNELFHPGWHAFAGEHELVIYPTNAVMRGLVIEPGVDQVRLRFQPFFRPLTALLGLALAGCVLAVAWLLLTRLNVGRQ